MARWRKSSTIQHVTGTEAGVFDRHGHQLRKSDDSRRRVKFLDVPCRLRHFASGLQPVSQKGGGSRKIQHPIMAGTIGASKRRHRVQKTTAQHRLEAPRSPRLGGMPRAVQQQPALFRSEYEAEIFIP